MKRTTIYLAPDLEVRLKTETQRRGQPMAQLVREAIEVYLAGPAAPGPPGAGEFASGHTDTAARAEVVLGELDFGGTNEPGLKRRTASPRPGRRPKRRS